MLGTQKRLEVSREQLNENLRTAYIDEGFSFTVETLRNFARAYAIELSNDGDEFGLARQFLIKIGSKIFDVVSYYDAMAEAKAKAEADIALAGLEEMRIASEARLTVALDRLSAARDAYAYYTGEAIPQAEELRRLSAAEYSSGEISYVEYMQNLSTALDTEIAGAQAADRLNQAIIEINYIKGN